MEGENLSELKTALYSHAKVVECLATLNSMNVENDEYRSQGKPDLHHAESFNDLAREIGQYAEDRADL